MKMINKNGQKFNKKIIRNMRRVLGSRIFKYKNIHVEVVRRSPTYVYAEFFETSITGYTGLICRINIFEKKYTLVAFDSKEYITLVAKNLLFDRLRIYKWLHNTIKEYRRGFINITDRISKKSKTT